MADKNQILDSMKKDANESGFFLCPDKELLADLIDGLAKNQDRYGFASCPCRISCGIKEYDSDIICPCEYRDADINDHGACYCGLFVSKAVGEDPSRLRSIPERRPIEAQNAAMEALRRRDTTPVASLPLREAKAQSATGDSLPVWRCKICGYLAARETPPPICPVCKAKADRFHMFAPPGFFNSQRSACAGS